MDVDATFKSISSIYQAITGKSDAEVYLTYKGTRHGITKPYIVKIEAREASHVTYDGALAELLSTLKKELSDKITSTESEAKRLRQAFNQLGN